MNSFTSEPDLLEKLKVLQNEHRDLDGEIGALQDCATFDQLAITRLKRRKLALKDEITRLSDALYPDIIA